jgi:Tol biopolymer transport system component
MSDRTGQTSIWIGGTNGENQAPLFTRQGGTPRWSPNGRTVVLDSPSGKGDFDIWTISSSGGVPRPLTQGPADDHSPNWSRDGKWIYFASDRGRGFQLWKKNVDSGEERQVTRSGGFYSDESVDGRYVYYTKGRSDWTVWKVPAFGGPEEQVLDSVSSWNNFDVTERGIFYTPKRGPDGTSAILFHDFSDGTIKLVFEPGRPISNGLSVARDGKSLLYTQIDRDASDLMLVEDFR